MKGLITVYELKKDKVSVSSFFQVIGYLKGIKTYLEKRGKENLFNYKIVLIGNEIDLNSTVCYLPSLFDLDCYETPISKDSVTNVEIYKYKFNIDGLFFEQCYDYNLKNKGF